jgi:hypothetical protein
MYSISIDESLRQEREGGKGRNEPERERERIALSSKIFSRSTYSRKKRNYPCNLDDRHIQV